MGIAAMRKLNELLRVFVTRAASQPGEYLRISRGEGTGRWVFETRRCLTADLDLPAAADAITDALRAQYPDPEELERAEYERLRLKFGGDPLPPPPPPGVWVGYEQCYDEITFRAAFETEAEAQAWVIGRPGSFVEHIPYPEP